MCNKCGAAVNPGGMWAHSSVCPKKPTTDDLSTIVKNMELNEKTVFEDVTVEEMTETMNRIWGKD